MGARESRRKTAKTAAAIVVLFLFGLGVSVALADTGPGGVSSPGENLKRRLPHIASCQEANAHIVAGSHGDRAAIYFGPTQQPRPDGPLLLLHANRERDTMDGIKDIHRCHGVVEAEIISVHVDTDPTADRKAFN